MAASCRSSPPAATSTSRDPCAATSVSPTGTAEVIWPSGDHGPGHPLGGGVDREQAGGAALLADALGERDRVTGPAAQVEVGEGHLVAELGDRAGLGVDDRGEGAPAEQPGAVGEVARRVDGHDRGAGSGQAGVADPLVGVHAGLAEGGHGPPLVAGGGRSGEHVEPGRVTGRGQGDVGGLRPARPQHAVTQLGLDGRQAEPGGAAGAVVVVVVVAAGGIGQRGVGGGEQRGQAGGEHVAEHQPPAAPGETHPGSITRPP